MNRSGVRLEGSGSRVEHEGTAMIARYDRKCVPRKDTTNRTSMFFRHRTQEMMPSTLSKKGHHTINGKQGLCNNMQQHAKRSETFLLINHRAKDPLVLEGPPGHPRIAVVLHVSRKGAEKRYARSTGDIKRCVTGPFTFFHIDSIQRSSTGSRHRTYL